jgi:hypothetical protein
MVLTRMFRTLLLATLLLTVLAPAASAREIDVPKRFATQLERARTQTTVPILLPQTMRSDFRRFFAEGRATVSAWRFDLAAARGCNQATACFIAEFKGVRDGKPRARRTIRLDRGRTGYYRPLSCGASCSPPSIEWRERHALYSIQAKVGKRELVRMANSAIRNGPRLP